jgi:hypothetical protein
MSVYRADPAECQTIEFRVDRNAEVVISFYDSAGDPIDMLTTYPTVSFEFFMKNTPNSNDKLISLISELTWSDTNSKLHIPFTNDIMQLRPNMYYYELYRIDLKKTWLNGDGLLINGKYCA